MNERRRFLRVLGGATAVIALPSCAPSGGSSGSTSGAGGGGTGGGGAGGSTGACATPAGIAVGPASTYQLYGLHLVPGTSVLIGSDANGLYALSAVCTHQGCNMDQTYQGYPLGTVYAGGIQCNCHGSRFDVLGNVVSGPAYRPLVAFALAVGCDGTLYADTTAIVPNSQRVTA